MDTNQLILLISRITNLTNSGSWNLNSGDRNSHSNPSPSSPIHEKNKISHAGVASRCSIHHCYPLKDYDYTHSLTKGQTLIIRLKHYFE